MVHLLWRSVALERLGKVPNVPPQTGALAVGVLVLDRTLKPRTSEPGAPEEGALD